MHAFARVLVLVACVPLLQPAGLCVCGARASVPTRARVLSAPAEPDTCANPARKCCSHKRAAAARVAHPAAPPAPADHQPGCPASPGADAQKWVEPAPSPSAVALAVASPFAPEPAVVLPHARALPAAEPAFGPPFLAHTRLRI